MAMFGDLGLFASQMAISLAGMWTVRKFLQPTRGHMHFLGFAVGFLCFGMLALGACVSFFDPPPPVPAKVAPIGIPGQSTYAPPAPSPYK